ncbi:MAG: prolyl oligopeptidase family serine peptidase [Tannerellaceae bacterium]|jgi:dipeptidyl aminopeptidase/acylaminoacyl peptidase|nr:prolyl oligopeptidase family serine peptidase [Tannerellaceae bacterium]
MNRIKIILGLAACAALPAVAQTPKKSMTVEDLVAWERITAKSISDDGMWVSAKMEPWKGDVSIYVYNRKGEEVASFRPAKESEFSVSHYLLVTKTATLEETEALKLKKTKDDQMPMDRLAIYDLSSKKEESIDSIRSYKLSESADWLAYQRGRKADSTLYIRTLDGSQSTAFPRVTNFFFSKENNVLYYVTAEDSAGVKPGLYACLPGQGDAKLIWGGDGVFKHITADEKGSHLAFLYCADKDSTDTGFALYMSKDNNPAHKIAERHDTFLPSQWVISENGELTFSKNARRLFFGIAPQPKQKDTTILADNRPNVHIWNWNEKIQYTQQDYNRAEDLKKTYKAVCNLREQTFVTLTTPELTTLQTVENDDVSVALLSTTVPYDLERMWEGANRSDVYSVNLQTGDLQPVIKETTGRVRLSPEGKYAYWYNPKDSSWYTHSIAGRKEYRLTTPSTFIAWDEDNDVPSYPDSHGIAGWTTGDEAILIYDRFDIWRFDPTAATAPVSLTVGGRSGNIAYRRMQLDKDETHIDPGETQLLRGFNHTTKGYGYYNARFATPSLPQTLLAGDFMLSAPVKAKKSDAIIYTSETFSKYPDVLLSDRTFKRSVQLTQGIRQQDAFIWGTAELTSWVSLDGRRLEGVIYKPVGFDPGKKYPVIVNFYERNSETYHSYRMPEANRSTVDYHFYNSNGYIVFNPDIIYDDGYPGESCFKSVMPGVAALIAKGYVNEKAIAAQGHSWGGYQDAYLATRTNLFAAIESGAPVVNMLSAYGGIRWGSGLNRSFQYEHGQSRIGASIWESPLRYIENSPLFDMDKVKTPILIMANDNDGHVPWYQGIEFFVALKRLQKPAWLLNYTGEPHWPMRMANRIDFQKRMFQFFEHYLNNKPMPGWMSEGVPAVERDFELGY